MSAVRHPSRHARRIAPLVVALAIGLMSGACSKKDDAAADAKAAAATKAAQQVVPPQPAVAAKVAAMAPDELRAAASTSMREQRLYAPAGDNAMEYYLALRDKQPNDPAVSSALTDLQPYAVIATEQARDRDDFVDAQRLYALMEKADAQAPALPRLKQSIADAQASLAARAAEAATQSEEEKKRAEELAKKREEEQKKAQQTAAQELARQQATEQTTAQQRVAEQRATEQRATEQRAAEERAAAARAAQARPTPAPTTATPAPATSTPAPARAAPSNLVVVSTPAPRYPPEALRTAQSGEVQVEFTVGTDGSVSAARVVRSNPAGVFDREALSAVKRWRFQPVAAPVTTRRTIGFNPGT